MRMLRSAVIVTQRNHVVVMGRRSLVTAQQKRVQQQGQSNNKTPSTIPSATSTPVPPPPPSSGSGNLLPMLAVGALGAAGAAYYMDVIPPFLLPNNSEEKTQEPIVTTTKEEEEKEVVDVVVADNVEKKQDTPVVDVEEKVETKVEMTKDPKVVTGNRVTQISVPPAVDRPPQIVPEPTYLENANRVSVILPQTNKKEEESGSMAKESIVNELQQGKLGGDDDDDESLENLSPEQLRWKVAQLLLELKERTKWEAVRLQEYLKRKEGDMEHHYMEILQKQRLELEQVLARKLLEQEAALTRQSNQLLQEKEQSISTVIDAATNSLQEEHNAELSSMTDRLTKELSAQYQMEYASQLAGVKENFQEELKDKVEQLEALSQKVLELQNYLTKSRQFEEKSVSAHGVSAAALAMINQCQTNQPVAQQVATLSGVASNNPVITSALSSLPSSALADGIPTLSDLQSHFVQHVYPSTREVRLYNILCA